MAYTGLGAVTDIYTGNGAGIGPSFKANPGIEILDGSSGSATGTTVTITGGTTGLTTTASGSTLSFGGVLIGANGGTGVANTGLTINLGTATLGYVLTSDSLGNAAWAAPASSGTVTTVSVASANGFTGTVATASTTPVITLATSVTGVLSGNGTAITGSAITQYDVLVGGASNAISSVGPGSAGQLLRSAGAGANPAYTTSTYPATNAANTLVYASSANVMAALATANSAILNTSASGVPSLATSPSISGSYISTGGNLVLPATNSSFSQGVIIVGGARQINFYSPSNVGNIFIGPLAGNGTLTGYQNYSLGYNTLNALSTGNLNTAIGSQTMSLGVVTGTGNLCGGLNAGNQITSGSYNILWGHQVVNTLTTGSFNIVSGYQIGTNYTSSESSNIVFNGSTVTGESNVLRFGSGTGTGPQNLNTAYMHGVFNNNSSGFSSPKPVWIDTTTGQLGYGSNASSISITGDAGGALVGNAFIFTGGTTGLTFTGSGAGASETLGGTLAIANGGTNASSFTQTHGIVVYDGTRLVNYAGPQLSTAGIYTNTSQPCFDVVVQSAVPNVTGDGTIYNVFSSGETIIFDNDSNFSAGVFTAPITGNYQFNVTIGLYGVSAAFTQCWVDILLSGGINNRILMINPGTMFEPLSGYGLFSITGSVIVAMGVGGTAQVMLQVANSTKSIGIGLNGTWKCAWSGALLC